MRFERSFAGMTSVVFARGRVAENRQAAVTLYANHLPTMPGDGSRDGTMNAIQDRRELFKLQLTRERARATQIGEEQR
jgi:hypothetical protein